MPNNCQRQGEKCIMKYRIEGNELIIKSLFSEKRYDFRELTKVSFVEDIYIYKEDKCIFKDNDLNNRAMYAMDIFHLAVKNNLIFEDQEWFDDEISVDDVSGYSISIQNKIKEEYYDYVKQELGDEYELEVSAEMTPYHVILFVNILRYGEKMFINDAEECKLCYVWRNGKKDIALHYFELVMPTYIDVHAQKFRLTKLVDLQAHMEEIKGQIDMMKRMKIVTVSSLLKDS